MTEATVTRDIKQWVKNQGGLFLKISHRYISGIPDCWICINGISAWIEIKRPSGKRRPMQEWTIKQILNSGGNAGFAENIEDVKKILYKQTNV